MEIVIYQDQYQDQVIDLILPIQQQEFGSSITLADQPDLLEIPRVYQQGKGNFWVALEDGRVIGTIGAIAIDDKTLILRKMFVNVNYRGKDFGIGQGLMNTLLSWARKEQIREIYLGTIEAFKAAQGANGKRWSCRF
ncbi:MAG: GNAT family N-acetyltransferase [Oculatellaceae cyanobacterium Prado106]|jgi:N-acetylglutamate synthase-like GNAT family acetyltransferase|nr:GNAT family N-acetyltransferase [Oculatellaceae cyanobacterium Prado106]